ncbi:esterase/lipase family protein [Bailinhaonella thermotolerans]|uniref:esterase/lipase family protein n=1 Tax=Bailinhaonella thermotolerans TaxID=1070861 RepID=UPI00192A267A|nr:alpha/beta fold hydrolase [Bailinhaonella thermotolerans]
MRAHPGVAAVTAAVCGALLLAPARPARAEDPPPSGKPLANFPATVALSMTDPERSPAGANDWSCRPTPRHPEPVVLVHGTWANAYNSWSYMAPALRRAGYCVFALNYGAPRGRVFKATGDIRRSAAELGRFVDRVRTATGARKVALVGHSQGGMMPRWYLRYGGGANPADPSRNKVSQLISLGASHHGTSLNGIGNQFQMLGLERPTGAALGTAARQQLAGSPFLVELNKGGDTVPGVHYTAIASRYDEVVNPFRLAFLSAGPGATVDNILLQDGCPADLADHLDLMYDPRVLHHVERALAARGPLPRGSRDAVCRPFLPVAGVPLH